MPTIATRKLTLESAQKMADDCARATLRIIAETARADARIAEQKARLAEKTAEDAALVAKLEPKVIAYLLANKDEICEERKKTLETALSKIGFRKCTDVVLEDPQLVLEFAMGAGYVDLFTKPDPKLSKPAIRKRIDAGEAIPGARLDSDFEPFVSPQKTLLDQAKRGEVGCVQ